MAWLFIIPIIHSQYASILLDDHKCNMHEELSVKNWKSILLVWNSVTLWFDSQTKCEVLLTWDTVYPETNRSPAWTDRSLGWLAQIKPAHFVYKQPLFTPCNVYRDLLTTNLCNDITNLTELLMQTRSYQKLNYLNKSKR